MFSSKAKALVSVCALLIVTSLVAVGCGLKEKNGWVNTNSLPGHTYSSLGSNDKHNNVTVVYLGANDNSSGIEFGPKDISFEFRDLK